MRNSGNKSKSSKNEEKSENNFWKIEYEERVVKFLEVVSPDITARLKNSIEFKLARNPEIYGIPLRGPFKGYYKFRIGDYRSIFSINGNIILLVVLIAHRKNVYGKFKSLL